MASAHPDRVVVLVSGGNTGIGYEIVKKLAKEHPDHHILMGCRDTSKGEVACSSMGAPTNVNPIQLDVTSDKSLNHAFKTIEQVFGRLDVLINNAGTAGGDMHPGVSLREKYTHVYSVNAIGSALLTETMIPLLEKSTRPAKMIFITTRLGSIEGTLKADELVPVPFYASSKAAVNYLCVYYSRKFPEWRVNACCPGLRATGLHTQKVTEDEDTDPAKGAVNAVRLVLEAGDGATGTYSDTEGIIPW